MTQTSLFEPATGLQLRDRGISKAVQNAEKRTPGWSEQAYEMLRLFLASKGGTFMAEEVRLWSHGYGLPKPPNARAWGGVFLTAKKRGLIRCVGISAVTNNKAHCANAGVWERMQKGD